MWKPLLWIQVLCVVLTRNVDAVDKDGVSDENLLDNVIKEVENNTNVEDAERTYIFNKTGEVSHEYVEDHEDIHQGRMEELIQAWQKRNESLEAAKKAGKKWLDLLDPHGDREENYQLLKEDVKNETRGNGTFYDPDIEAGTNENSTEYDAMGRRKRIIEKSEERKWPKAIVPYWINPNTMDKLDDYKRAMNLIEEYSCVKFVPWDANVKDKLDLGHPSYLKFTKANGCWSYRGNTRWSDGQKISCCTGYTCVHELGHALGFAHEHQSPQRDGWLRINLENVKPASHDQYEKISPDGLEFFQGYDMGSIMHYSQWTGGSGATMTILFPELFPTKSNAFYTFSELSSAYKCAETEPCKSFTTKCENDGYVTLVKGKCACRCPPGFDPETGCTTILKVKNGLKMPRGQYALPKPKTGCPDGSFQDGQVIHYSEGRNIPESPTNLMDKITYERAEHHFCTRDIDDGPGGDESDWPSGAYCILRKGGKCPAGFLSGFVQYDDVPQTPGKVNSKSGELPDGVFGADTRMEFCCQYNGFYNIPISFPTKNPFVLYSVDHQCQEIIGMHVKSEQIGIDSYNDGGMFKFEGKFTNFIYEQHQVLYLTYCYYTPADLDSGCGGVIDIDEANPQTVISSDSTGHPNVQCTWIVKGPNEKGTLLLNFEEFDVKSNGKQSCVDKVEVRHVRIGQDGLIYCGQGDQRSIRSVFDKMLIQFSTQGDSTSHFKAVIKWIPDDDLCYDVSDKGASYAGKVSYSRIFEPCLPWSEVTHCPHHPWQNGDEIDNLEENYCRNPDNSLRPWCYTEAKGCKRNYCDVCKLESRFDRAQDCKQKRIDGFCTEDQDKAVHSCAKECSDLLPSTGAVKKYSEIECDPPVPPPDGEIVGQLKSKYKLGEEVSYKCKDSSDTLPTTCLTDGSWSPLGYVCTECPIGSKPFGESCYILKSEDYTYPKAKEACQKIGGKVAMPKTQAENDAMASIANENSVWIGLTDEETEGTFVWEDGTPLTWTNWEKDEPNNWQNQEHCTVMNRNKKWNDNFCDIYWATWGQSAVVCSVPKADNVPCEDFIGDKCATLLTAKPKMCMEHAAFAKRFCKKTCGICGSDAIKCTVPTVSPPVTVLTKETSIPVGGYIQYKCLGGTVPNGGSEYQACQRNGQFTPKGPLTCKKPLHTIKKVGLPTLSKHNYRLPPRTPFTGENEFFRVQHKGVIMAWEYYSNSPVETNFQVWRASQPHRYRLIGVNKKTTGNDMEERFEVPSNERIQVEPGDLIGLANGDRGGVHFGPCDFQESPVNSRLIWSYTVSSLSRLAVNSDWFFGNSGGCYRLPLRAEIAVQVS